MLKKWIKYLCDPIDKAPLTFYKITEKRDQDVITGILKSKSGKTYEIKNGVPILLTGKTQSTKSVESFAYEWKTFDFDYGKEGWLRDIVKPIVGSTKYFKNKVVMDCGAGSGRQSLWMAEAGAKFVFSVELSDSAISMVKNVTERFKNKVFVIQGDIAHLPIKKRKAKIDAAYCVNVIQHTKNPTRATKEISRLLNKKSDFIFNIYLKKNRHLITGLIAFIKKIVGHFPLRAIKAISFFGAVIVLPMKSNKSSFKEFWLDIYDLMGTHTYQKFYTEKEVQKILDYSKLNEVKKTRYVSLLKFK